MRTILHALDWLTDRLYIAIGTPEAQITTKNDQNIESSKSALRSPHNRSTTSTIGTGHSRWGFATNLTAITT